MKRFLPVFLMASVLCFFVLVAADARGDQAVYSVGDRVASPAGYNDKWLQSVVVAVDPSNVFPYRVHPLGYMDTMNQSFMASMLRPMGTVQTEPLGGIKDDPWLMKINGTKAFHPESLYYGKYECWSGMQSAMILNFQILNNQHYRDVNGSVANYHFNPNTSVLIFQGGTLKGLEASYEQASNPPTASQPPTVTFKVSGDHCQRSI